MPPVLAATAGGIWSAGKRDGWLFEGKDVTALSTSRDGLWALVEGAEVWRSSDGFAWEQVAAAPSPPARCVLSAGAGVFVGTAQAHLLRLTDGRLEPVAGFEEVEGRDGWYTPWGGPPDTRSLSGTEDALYANVHVGGIPRSTDGGRSWRATIDVDADVHQVLAVPEHAGLVVAACARGLARSEDGGTSWRYETDGLLATYCRAVAVAGDTLLVSASTGPRGGQAAVYRAPLGGGDFDKCGGGLPEWFAGNVDSHCLAGSGAAAAVGTARGDLFRSGDAGRTWEPAADGLPPVRAVVLAG